MRYSKILVMVWMGLLMGLLPYEVVAKDYNFIVRVQVNSKNVEADGVEISPKSGGTSTQASFVKSSNKGTNIYTAKLPKGKYIVKVSKDGYITEEKEVQIPNKFGEVIVPLKKGKATTKLSKKEDTSEQPVAVKTHSLHISNLPSGTFEIEINGEKQLVKITDQDVSLDAIKDFYVDTKRKIVCEGEHTLEFVRVKPATDNGENVITLSLTEDQAKTFYQESQQLSGTSPLQPLILKSVSETPNKKVISEFWIQTETMEKKLYEEIIPSGSVDKVSYNEAKTVIEALNNKCQGSQFELPTEEQFVYLARKVYNPVRDKDKEDAALERCQVLKGEVSNYIKQLLGNKWQLTQTRCESWSTDSSDPIKQCSDSPSYIKKGGTTESRDATECMPEYRAESTPDVSEPNTTIRLVLKLNHELGK